MSQDSTYIFSICIMKNYFRETLGDHYPYEIITSIIMALRDSKILDLKIRLKSAIHKLPCMNYSILQIAQCSLNTELSNLISSYYPIFHAEYIELDDTFTREDWAQCERIETIVAMTRRWVCQIVDGLGSEESLYELAMD